MERQEITTTNRRTRQITVASWRRARAVAERLLESSQSFGYDPLPDDCYQFTVNAELPPLEGLEPGGTI